MTMLYVYYTHVQERAMIVYTTYSPGGSDGCSTEPVLFRDAVHVLSIYYAVNIKVIVIVIIIEKGSRKLFIYYNPFVHNTYTHTYTTRGIRCCAAVTRDIN